MERFKYPQYSFQFCSRFHVFIFSCKFISVFLFSNSIICVAPVSKTVLAFYIVHIQKESPEIQFDLHKESTADCRGYRLQGNPLEIQQSVKAQSLETASTKIRDAGRNHTFPYHIHVLFFLAHNMHPQLEMKRISI